MIIIIGNFEKKHADWELTVSVTNRHEQNKTITELCFLIMCIYLAFSQLYV